MKVHIIEVTYREHTHEHWHTHAPIFFINHKKIHEKRNTKLVYNFLSSCLIASLTNDQPSKAFFISLNLIL